MTGEEKEVEEDKQEKFEGKKEEEEKLEEGEAGGKKVDPFYVF